MALEIVFMYPNKCGLLQRNWDVINDKALISLQKPHIDMSTKKNFMFLFGVSLIIVASLNAYVASKLLSDTSSIKLTSKSEFCLKNDLSNVALFKFIKNEHRRFNEFLLLYSFSDKLFLTLN
ncbi:hypothetical protein EGR_04680 [Echinococcus granulosus]|uniref:Uncharacterized protein n=1 Tax=Echinococcus granulosus TaxID=6210 RepID=W6UHE9_ECHGR|nr:hypothetical protein EGR_04680 [Echinococcus granulosus]EUB60486.1 hypothetical protein EGR_04680 [Echinococcus granulosus]